MFGLTYKGRVEGAHTFVVTDPAWRRRWCPDCVAFMWGRFVVYRSPRHFQDLSVRAHEGAHVNQSRRLGFLLYTWLYWYQHQRKGYRHNPFEVEARQASVKRVQQSVERLKAVGLRVEVRPPRAKQSPHTNKEQSPHTNKESSEQRNVRAVIYF